MTRDLGSEAEHYFASLCANAGLVANGSRDKDAYGWDFYVEFPICKDENHPRDELPTPISCKVQVKATQGKSLSCSMKLSTIERLVKAREPAFICLFVYEDAGGPSMVYLRHVDSGFCERVLKRLRESSASGSLSQLSHKSFHVSFNQNHALGEVSGLALQESISEAVGQDYNQYLLQKLAWLNTLGYEEGAHSLQVTFSEPGEKGIETIVDLFAGLTSEVPVSKIEATKTRFGIAIPDNDLSAVGDIKMGLVNLEPKFQGRLTFREEPLTRPILFDAAFYAPPTELNIPDEKVKIRAVTSNFEVVFHGPKANFTLTWDPARDCSLDELWKVCWLVLRIYWGKSVYLGFIKDGVESHLGPLSTDKIPKSGLEGIDGEAVASLYEICSNARVICGHLALDLEYVSVCESVLRKFESQISLLHTLVSDSRLAFKISIPDAGFGTQIMGRRVAIVAASKLRIGSACFAFAFAVVAGPDPAKQDEEALIYYSQETRLGSLKYGTTEEIEVFDIEILKRELADKLDAQGFVTILHDGA